MFLRMMRLKFLALVLLVWVSLVQAQKLEEDQELTSYPIQKGSSFQTTYLEYFDGEGPDGGISVQNLNLERGYYLLKRVSLVKCVHLLSANGHTIDRQDPDQKKMDANIVGLGLAGMVRMDLVRINRFQLFIDTGLGFLLCSGEFPPGGTFLNFTQRYGIGISVRFLRNINLLLGGRRLHVSNGGYHRNPSYNGNGAFVGLMYGF